MHAPAYHLRGFLVFASIVLLSGASPLVAQEPDAGVIGRIYDERTGEPIIQVVILLDSVPQTVSVSSQGRFVLTKLSPGKHRFEIRSIGYRPHPIEVTLAPGQVAQYEFNLVFTGERLAELAVEARNSKLLNRFADFERRRQHGLGHFITRDEIKSRGYLNLGDAMRTVKGVRVNCGAIECLIRMARAAPGCHPTYYVDGNLARSFAENTPISDIQGIEVYRGSAELPGEFSGSGSMCGVIAVWTRAAP
ncbi:MAG: TonB-dependent receptor plug domain-containing protein [Gemmatimonadales bacterium]|nr:TonB-dependent receptor plug domain-containing protein [Gemmatimonadales bacterium]